MKVKRFRKRLLHIGQMEKKKKVLIAIFSFLGLALIIFFGYKFFTTKQKEEFHVSFMNVDSKWADSVLDQMSADEKLRQLFIVDLSHYSLDSAKQFLRDTTIFKTGGIIMPNLPVNEKKNLISFINNKIIIRPFLIDKNIMSIADADSTYPDFPSWPAAFMLDDSLFNVYTNCILNKMEYSHMDIALFPLTHPFLSYSIKEDSIAAEIILKKTIQLIKKFDALGYMTALHLNSFSESNNRKSDFPFIQKATFKGLPAFFYDSVRANNELFEQFNNGSSDSSFNGLQFAYVPKNQKELKAFFAMENLLYVLHGKAKSPDQSILKYQQYLSKKPKESIDMTVKKVLMAKYWMFTKRQDDTTKKTHNFSELYFRKKAIELSQNTIALCKNNDVVPVKSVSNLKTLIISHANNDISVFLRAFDYYSPYKQKKIRNQKDIEDILEGLKHYNNIIVVTDSHTPDSILQGLAEKLKPPLYDAKKVLFHIGHPKSIESLNYFDAIIQTVDDQKTNLFCLPQVLFGGFTPFGQPFYSNSDSCLAIPKDSLPQPIRLKYILPEELGISSEKLQEIDSIVLKAIQQRVMPGCQIFAAKDGKVFYYKAFGYHTYARRIPVSIFDVYDIASVTKVAGTTLAAMKMIQQNRLKLNRRLSDYFRDKKIHYKNIKTDTIVKIDTFYFKEVTSWKNILKDNDTLHITDTSCITIDTVLLTLNPKNNIFMVRIEDMLIHKSGLPPGIPILRFLKYKNDSVNNFDEYYTRKYDKDTASIKIASGLYLKNRYFDTLWSDIKQMKVYSKKVYQYSDANMILLQMAMDSINRYPITTYLNRFFYRPLGLQTIRFKPIYSLPKSRIIPTELDRYWRHQTLLGYVHDPSAALLGGYSGNAGLFSNANDLGIIFQMLINNGQYGGQVFLSASIVKEFTQKHQNSHRGLGFDKPSSKSIIAPSASRNSFGHTGFTGTCVWADRDNGLIFVFLSNRVHPSVKNWSINKKRVRQNVHEVLYKAIDQSTHN